MTTASDRAELVALAKSCVADRAYFTYAEVRPWHLSKTWPWKGDCSTFVTWCFWMKNLPDPNKTNFAYGNTQTLYAQGQKITLAEVQPGDVVVYDADKPLQYQHTAIVVEGGHDPLTVSMGQQGDPSFVHVSQDGRTPFYVRFLPPDPVTHPAGSTVTAHATPAGANAHPAPKPAPITKSSPVQDIKNWQKAHGLVPDGIIGPLTTAKLHSLGFA